MFQRCPDVVSRNLVFSRDLRKRHSACKTPHSHGDGESRTADYWFASADGGIKEDPILQVQCSNAPLWA